MAINEGSTLFNVLGRLLAQLPLLPSVAILLLLGWSIRQILRSKRLNLPVVGKSGQDFYGDDVVSGARKYPDTPFIIPSKPPIVILPISTMEEVRNLPEHKVSFNKDVQQNFSAQHTGIGKDNPASLKAVKTDLTRNIANVIDGLQDEIRFSLNKELGPCEDWTAVTLYPSMLRIIALLTGRVFVGRPLSRTEEWIDATINFTIDAVKTSYAIAKWPVFLRYFVAPFLPEIRRIKRYRTRGGELLGPILKQTIERARGEKQMSFEGDEQGTFISWVLKHTAEGLRDDAEQLATSQMLLSFAAIHTTTMGASQAVLDLVSRPEYLQPLREEIQQVIDEDGQDRDGDEFLKLKKTSLTKLKKLDSFLKESQRVNTQTFVSNVRLTTAPLKLSTGHTFPTNTRIGYPAHAVHTSPATITFSPAYNPPSTLPPSQFDGFRFYNLRQIEGKENKHQFVTTSVDSLSFGHGNHACPGRFFASNEIKVVMVELLRSWDFRLKGDLLGVGGEDKRPKNVGRQFGYSPDAGAQIEFRRRVVEH